MNPSSAAGTTSLKAQSNVEVAFTDIDSLTEELNDVAGQLERVLSWILLAAPPRADSSQAQVLPVSETGLLTSLHRQRDRLKDVLGRFRELSNRVSL